MLTNRQRTDNDPSFKISITGYSRAEWSVVLEVLHEWQAKVSSQAKDERTAAIKTVYQALQSHVVDNNDGYQLSAQPRQLTELESACLSSVRDRRSKELEESKKLAKQISAAQRKSKRKGSI